MVCGRSWWEGKELLSSGFLEVSLWMEFFFDNCEWWGIFGSFEGVLKMAYFLSGNIPRNRPKDFVTLTENWPLFKDFALHYGPKIQIFDQTNIKIILLFNQY